MSNSTLSSEEQVSGDSVEDLKHHKPTSKEQRWPYTVTVWRERGYQYSKQGHGVCVCVFLKGRLRIMHVEHVPRIYQWGARDKTQLKSCFVLLPETWVQSLTITKTNNQTNKCLYNLKLVLKHAMSPFPLLPHLKAWPQFIHHSCVHHFIRGRCMGRRVLCLSLITNIYCLLIFSSFTEQLRSN